jgi:hypothetical protein
MSGRRKQSGNSATCSYHKKRCIAEHTKPESKSKRGEKHPLLLRDLHKQSSAEEDWVWERGALDCSSRDPSALSFPRLDKTLPYGTLQIRFCSMWEHFHKNSDALHYRKPLHVEVGIRTCSIKLRRTSR